MLSAVQCSSVNILAVMPNELDCSDQYEREGGSNGLPVLGTCLNSELKECVSNDSQHQQVIDAVVVPVKISLKKITLLLPSSLLDFCGILSDCFTLARYLTVMAPSLSCVLHA